MTDKWSGMESQRRKGPFSTLLLILGAFAFMGIQAAHHKHEIQFTVVGTGNSLLEFIMVNFVDDIQVFFYDKRHSQLMAKEAWISQVLGAKFIEKTQQKLIDHEKSFLWFLKKLRQNDTKSDKNITLQFFVVCEPQRDSDIGNQIKIAVDGEDFCWFDEIGQWIFLMPEAESFKPSLMSTFWANQKASYMQEYCDGIMKKILQHSGRKNVPPEVTVLYHEDVDGTISLSCSATGFYPSSILLHWQKGSDMIVSGKESSSSTLPNADGTFYQRITIELPPGDTGTNHECVVDHIELGTPKVFSVPEKLLKKRTWTVTLSILGIVILVLSCAVAFIQWKKTNTGYSIHEYATMEDIQMDTQEH